MTQIIGLVGYAQTGKDEAAQTLAPLGWSRISFADGVREALYALDPEVNYYNEIGLDCTTSVRRLVDQRGWEEAKRFPHVRELLQRMGTEAGRDIHGPDCWVDRAMRHVGPDGRHIFTDVRFPNEAAAIRACGGVLVRVTRSGVGPVNGHVSDQGVAEIECDDEWVNDGDLEAWRKKVQEKVGMLSGMGSPVDDIGD